jgi:hypothetical protein
MEGNLLWEQPRLESGWSVKAYGSIPLPSAISLGNATANQKSFSCKETKVIPDYFRKRTANQIFYEKTRVVRLHNLSVTVAH